MYAIIQLLLARNKNISWTLYRNRHAKTLNKILLFFVFVLVFFTGCKNREITKSTPQMDTSDDYWVRVLLLDNSDLFTLQIASGFSIINDNPNQIRKGQILKIEENNNPIEVSISENGIILGQEIFPESLIVINPDEPHIFSVNGIEYRGKLQLIANPNNNSLDAINLIPLESYLAGVAGAEMPDYWEPEALKAQVITARTYCLYIKRRFGSNRDWDVSKTAAHQVYNGVAAESASVWEAVNQTQGKILTCQYPDGTEDIFPAYYSSTCGGHTENSINVFGESFSALVGVPCPYCKDVAKPKFFFWPMVMFDANDISIRLFEKYNTLEILGQITDIAVIDQSDYGDFARMTKIELTGSTGESEWLRAEDFRLTIDPTGRKIRSAACKLIKYKNGWAFTAGRGWGHGVGMCQCGAEGMARQGNTTEKILSHYYPGSKIATIDYSN